MLKKMLIFNIVVWGAVVVTVATIIWMPTNETTRQDIITSGMRYCAWQNMSRDELKEQIKFDFNIEPEEYINDINCDYKMNAVNMALKHLKENVPFDDLHFMLINNDKFTEEEANWALSVVHK